MNVFHRSRRFLRPTLWALIAWLPVAASAGAAEKLNVEGLKQVIRRHLRANPDYRPGDLICRADVEPIFNELIDQGQQASGDIEELYDSFLPERSQLAGLLRTPDGRVFTRGVASLPGAFDLLERLSWLTEGRLLIEELIVSPDGPKLVKKLLEPDNLRALEQKFASDPRGRNLSLPTGHVYTANQLVDHMKKKFSGPRGK